MSTSEGYCNVLPWMHGGCDVHFIKGDGSVEINVSELKEKVLKMSVNDVHVISLSCVSNVTG